VAWASWRTRRWSKRTAMAKKRRRSKRVKRPRSKRRKVKSPKEPPRASSSRAPKAPRSSSGRARSSKPGGRSVPCASNPKTPPVTSARGATATSSTASDLLRHGEVTVKGRMPWSSNATFLVELALNGTTGQAVYKPRRGERPLWDFPPALYRREIAAYLLSEALGWGLVPLTIEREGPFGDGSMQQFV